MKIFISAVFFSIIIIFYFTGCENSNGPVIVNQNNSSSGNHPPSVPTNPVPADNATNTSNIIILQWDCTDPDLGDTVKYDIYLSNTYPPAYKVGSDNLTTTFGFGLVDHNLKLYWKVVAKDTKGATSTSPVWTFTTAP